MDSSCLRIAIASSLVVLALLPGTLDAKPASARRAQPAPTKPASPTKRAPRAQPEQQPAPPAQPAPAQPAQPAPEQPETPAAVAEPGQESGLIVSPDLEPSTTRTVARGALLVPKGLVVGVTAPFRALMYLYDRYALRDLYYRVFYNDDRTFGIVPVAAYSTGYGFGVGARLISTDTFGDSEELTVEGTYGGSFQSRAAVSLDSGRRLDPVVLSVGGNFDRYARLRFAGIGNADLSPPPPMLIDPLVNPTAVETFYRYQELRAVVAADWRTLDDLYLIGRGAVTDLSYDPSTRSPAIDMVYNPADLVGFLDGITHFYGEIELRWDRRRVAVPRWESTRYTTGWLASAFVGGVVGLEDANNFAHYGFDLQGFLHFALGPRMLVLRLRGEGVTGDVDEVPFSELPYLGGDFLRGYDFARFRDRVAALGTAQYTWDLSRFTNAFVFVDVGRVYDGLDDLTFDDMRIGFGGGMEVQTVTNFIIGVTLASSIDGGLFLTARLSPIWNKVPRWR